MLDFSREPADANGNIRERTLYYDQNGNVVQDDNGRSPPGLHLQRAQPAHPGPRLPRRRDGDDVTYTRDFRGNPLTMTDENSHTTTYEYDHAGNLTKTTFADGTFTTRTYDELNRLASVTDERGEPHDDLRNTTRAAAAPTA